MCHSYIELSQKPREEMEIESGKKFLIKYYGCLRKNFFEFQMIRASYFHEISRLVLRIYLAEKHNINQTHLNRSLPPDAPKAEITAYLQSHPQMVSEAKLIQQNELSRLIIRSIFPQKNLHCGQIFKGPGLFTPDFVRCGAGNRLPF